MFYINYGYLLLKHCINVLAEVNLEGFISLAPRLHWILLTCWYICICECYHRYNNVYIIAQDEEWKYYYVWRTVQIFWMKSWCNTIIWFYWSQITMVILCMYLNIYLRKLYLKLFLLLQPFWDWDLKNTLKSYNIHNDI